MTNPKTMMNESGLDKATWLTYVLRWPTGASRDWVTRTLPELCANESVLAVVLLGSAIRPADSSFDFDCLYVYKGARPVFPRAPAEVDIRGFDSARIEQFIADGHDLLTWSIKLGRVVCERDGYWSKLRAEWLERMPFPSADVADKRAAKAEELLGELRQVGDEDAAVEQLVTALTHRARAALLRAAVFPASRPELPNQLREIGEFHLAQSLQSAMYRRNMLAHQGVGGRGDATDAA